MLNLDYGTSTLVLGCDYHDSTVVEEQVGPTVSILLYDEE